MTPIYHVDVSGPQALFGQIGTQAAGFERVLKRWGGYFKAQALRRADAAEGWPPLSQATRKKLEQTRTSAITAQATVRKGYASALERYLIREQNKLEAKVQNEWASAGAAAKLAGTSAAREAARSSPSADLQELRRLQAGGTVDRQLTKRGQPSSKAVAWQGSKAVDRLRRRVARAQDQKRKIAEARAGLEAARAAAGQEGATDKAHARLAKLEAKAQGKVRVGGDKRKAGNHKLLGRVARQIEWKLGGNRVSAFGRVPWGAVHNEGGSAGHGASEPKREHLAIRTEDETVLSEILLDHLLGGGQP